MMDQSDFLQNRRSRRSPVLLTARLVGAGGQFEVKLRNLSENGALIEGEDLPAEGSTAHFERKDLRVKCSLVWVEGRYAGLAFARPLKSEEVLRHISSPKPKAEMNIRRPGLACRPLSDYERKMLATWMTDSRFTLGD